MFHISFAGVVEKDKKYLCHQIIIDEKLQKYFDITFLQKPNLGEKFAYFMRETPEKNESIENILQRGFLEEMGAKVQVENFCGSSKGYFYKKNHKTEKTTIFYQCKLLDFDKNLRLKEDEENFTNIIWLEKNEFLKLNKGFYEKYPKIDCYKDFEILENLD